MTEYTRIKQEINETLQHFSRILQIHSPKLHFSSNKNFGGQYYKNKVTINQPIIENWDNERKVCEFLLAHELVHAKYDESAISEGLKSVLFPSVSVKLAFSELRANTMAYEITGSNELDLKHYFSNFYPYPIIPYFASSGGYLKGNQYIEFILLHPKWTTQTIEDVPSFLKRYSLWYRLVPKGTYLRIQRKFSII